MTRKASIKTADTEKWAQMPLTRLNAVRTIIVLLIAIGYASTMSPLDSCLLYTSDAADD